MKKKSITVAILTIMLAASTILSGCSGSGTETQKKTETSEEQTDQKDTDQKEKEEKEEPTVYTKRTLLRTMACFRSMRHMTEREL